ncbi:MAG: L,D-transpeptidase [Lachnospiraceae bacterium]|nr:L,D-transpeptidase [Lachnospiraceae bacterium]
MKTRTKLLIVLGALLAVVIIAAVVVWVIKPIKVYDGEKEKVVSLKNAKGVIEDAYDDAKDKENFTIFENGKEILKLSHTHVVDYSFDEDKINELKKANIFKYYMELSSAKTLFKWKMRDVDDLADLRADLDTINGERHKAKNAKITMTDEGVTLEKEEKGTKLLLVRVAKAVTDAINKGDMEVEVGDKDVYQVPRVTEKKLEKAYKRLDKYSKVNLKYTSGATLSWEDIKEHVTLKGRRVITDLSFIETFLNKLAAYYTSIGMTREFTPYKTKKKVTVVGGTYGNTMNREAESAYVKKAINRGLTAGNRVPEMSEKSKFGDGVNDFGKSFIEVSISDQHVKYIKNGKLLMESDCVTGRQGEHDTPKGVYFISEKVNGKYLEGDNYRTWVNKWMRLTNTGVGLHDATWRGRFGGNIYTYSGSHGCINLPLSFASSLYDAVETMTPVIIY